MKFTLFYYTKFLGLFAFLAGCAIIFSGFFLAFTNHFGLNLTIGIWLICFIVGGVLIWHGANLLLNIY